MQIRLNSIIKESTVDGIGIRYVIFVQGCEHHCKGCHNPESWLLTKGYLDDTSNILAEISKDKLLDGVTFSGGEPFLQQEPLTELAKEIHKLGLNIWCYTGFLYEDIKDTELAKNVDAIVDGKFEIDKLTRTGFKGSTNQRIIEVKHE